MRTKEGPFLEEIRKRANGLTSTDLEQACEDRDWLLEMLETLEEEMSTIRQDLARCQNAHIVLMAELKAAHDRLYPNYPKKKKDVA